MLDDVSKAQAVALAQAVIGVLVAFGAPITNEQSVALIALVGILAAILLHQDARDRRDAARGEIPASEDAATSWEWADPATAPDDVVDAGAEL